MSYQLHRHLKKQMSCCSVLGGGLLFTWRAFQKGSNQVFVERLFVSANANQWHQILKYNFTTVVLLEDDVSGQNLNKTISDIFNVNV